MRKSRPVPPQSELWKRLGEKPERLAEILARVPDPVVSGKYLHWDELKYRTPPEGLSHEEWWLGLKVRRMQSKRVPLRDAAGRPFSFNLVDPLPEWLHHVDSLARGGVRMPEAVANPETSRWYLVRSLIDEAITSSQLEGASTTRDVARTMIREGRKPRDRSERMIYNNYQVIQLIIDAKDQPLTEEFVFRIHGMVTEGTLDDPTGAGRYRRPEENVVVGDDTGEVLHEPPPAEELAQRMELMCRFANGDIPDGFVHPLARAIILHFWLAHDHPFVDGNGRAARALFYWSMLKQGYFLFEFLSISKIILKGPVRYGTAFLHAETDDNDLTYFLLYHAEVIRRALDELHDSIEDRTRRLRAVEAELRGMATLNHRQRDLVGHALRHPGHRYSIESHRKSHDVVYETARSDLMDLADRKLFVKHKVGRSYYFSPVPDLEDRLRR